MAEKKQKRQGEKCQEKNCRRKNRKNKHHSGGKQIGKQQKNDGKNNMATKIQIYWGKPSWQRKNKREM